MMKYRLSHPTGKLQGTIELTASKSESNRALVIQSLCAEKFNVENLAVAEDTTRMKEILSSYLSFQRHENTFDVGAAGTTMRFLTAYFATKMGTHVLTGSDRMKKRPIGILVEALRQLGANIEYMGEEGYPPLKVNGKVLKGGEIELDGSVSSQFVSALLLIAPELQNGLVIRFRGEVISRPYINMTLKMMEEFRVYGQWQDNTISVSKQNYHRKSEEDYSYKVEADWSSASYWYAMAALSDEVDLKIMGLKNPSLQGDAILTELFTFFGVKSEFIEGGVRLTKNEITQDNFGYDFSDCPDIAQTLAVVVAWKNIDSLFNGLQTLRIKETDRIEAMKNELAKIGAKLEVLSDSSVRIHTEVWDLKPKPIKTYEDHRMAMSFAALAVKIPVTIEDPEVVKKSYPGFWEDMKKMGFSIEEL